MPSCVEPALAGSLELLEELLPLQLHAQGAWPLTLDWGHHQLGDGPCIPLSQTVPSSKAVHVVHVRFFEAKEGTPFLALLRWNLMLYTKCNQRRDILPSLPYKATQARK